MIKHLIDAKKPIIGHNCIYDVAFLYHQFIERMPDNFEEFATKWRFNFP